MKIEIKNLYKNYYSEGKQIRAIDNVNLVIPANRIFTLLGPSGCGKTTLLRCIIGLESPDSGEIIIGDEIVWSKEKGIFVPPEKRGLSMVFQTYAIWPHMNVFDNIAYPLQTARVAKEEIKKRVKSSLEMVKLGGFEGRPATKLSGGQQQRVALARALVAEPKVILFDEPLSNLDAKLREETRKELRAFLTELKITAIYVTHDRLEALTLSDVIAVMKDGVIIEMGTPKDIYFSAKRKFVADFIGKTNLIDGKVKEINADLTYIDSPLGVVASPGKPGAAVGDKVVLCLRPELFEVVGSEKEKAFNTFKGKIESLLFVGECYEGVVSLGDTSLTVRFDPKVVLQEGAEINLHIAPPQCQMLLK